ncbi:MAG: M23 family metallopeptidase, partial [Elusimicrobia bacterium]|nr:M23 family metallopeptidase [Elusimicrobiota bacterium]
MSFSRRLLNLFLAWLLILETLPAQASPGRVPSATLTGNSEEAYSLTEGFFDGSLDSSLSPAAPSPAGPFTPDIPTQDNSLFSSSQDRIVVAQAGPTREDLRRRACAVDPANCGSTPDMPTTTEPNTTGGNNQTGSNPGTQGRQGTGNRNVDFNNAIEGEGIGAAIAGIPAIAAGIALLFTPFALFSIIPFTYSGLALIGALMRGKEGASLLNGLGYFGEAIGIGLGGILASMATTLTLGLVDTTIDDPKSWRSKLFNGANIAGRVLTLVGAAAVSGVAMAGLLPVPLPAAIAIGGAAVASAGGQVIAWFVRVKMPQDKLERLNKESDAFRAEIVSLNSERASLQVQANGLGSRLLSEVYVPLPPYQSPLLEAHSFGDAALDQRLDSAEFYHRSVSGIVDRARRSTAALRRQVNDLQGLERSYNKLRVTHEEGTLRALPDPRYCRGPNCRSTAGVDNTHPDYPNDHETLRDLEASDRLRDALPISLWQPHEPEEPNAPPQTTRGYLEDENLQDPYLHRGLDINASRGTALVSHVAAEVVFAGYYESDTARQYEDVADRLENQRSIRMNPADLANISRGLGNVIVLAPASSNSQLQVFQHLGRKEVATDAQGKAIAFNTGDGPVIIGRDIPGSGINVSQGDRVLPGTILGTVGNTGRVGGRLSRGATAGTHLHWGVIEVNPEINPRMRALRDGKWDEWAQQYSPGELDRYGQSDKQEVLYRELRKKYFEAMGWQQFDDNTGEPIGDRGQPNADKIKAF